jgi:hypothetical protein
MAVLLAPRAADARAAKRAHPYQLVAEVVARKFRDDGSRRHRQPGRLGPPVN